MQGKGLTALLIALVGVALLAGCGGGGEASSSTSAPGPASTSTEAQVPEEVREKLAEYKEKAIEERHKAEADKRDESAKPPQIEHHDSGGGSAQFRHNGGDNSIPDYGQEAGEAERQEAANSLHTYLDSVAAGRWQAACSYLSASLLTTLSQLPEISKQQSDLEGCPKILETLNSRTPQGALEAAANVDVASLRVKGEGAFLLYTDAGDEHYAMPMIREEGVWRVGALAGTAGF